MPTTWAEIFTLLWAAVKVLGIIAIVIYGLFEAVKIRKKIIANKQNKNMIDFSDDGEAKKDDK